MQLCGVYVKIKEYSSLRINGGHLGCCIFWLACSFAEVAVLGFKLWWPVEEMNKD